MTSIKSSAEGKQVYLLVDGENIDRTLGQILGHKPKPSDRPRWENLRCFIEDTYKASCKALFFLNATGGIHGSFIQALNGMGFTPIPLSSTVTTDKVVDIGILKTLAAIKEKFRGPSSPSVVLASHDADFKAAFTDLRDRSLGIVCFPEYLSGEYRDIQNLRIYDLEDDAKVFSKETSPLPRLRVIPVDDFDPHKYL